MLANGFKTKEILENKTAEIWSTQRLEQCLNGWCMATIVNAILIENETDAKGSFYWVGRAQCHSWLLSQGRLFHRSSLEAA